MNLLVEKSFFQNNQIKIVKYGFKVRKNAEISKFYSENREIWSKSKSLWGRENLFNFLKVNNFIKFQHRGICFTRFLLLRVTLVFNMTC